MADPLRIAGSPLGILSTGLTVAQGLFDYYQLYRGQSENVAHTAKKLKRLLDILESLRALLDHGNSQSRGCELPDKVRSSINDCEESIQELDEQLIKIRKMPDKDAIESLRASCRRMVYPFREGTLRKLEDDIADSVDGLSLALQLLQQGNLDSLQDDVEELLNLARATHSDDQIRSWISAPDPSINFNASVKKKHPGTGNWFVKGSRFQKWLETPSSFLWVLGFAGCGKSVLMTTIIQHTYRYRRSNPDTGIAFFFFTFNDETKQDCTSMLRSIVFQLSSQLEQMDNPLAQIHKSYRNCSPPDQVLLDCLHQIIRRFKGGAFILIDAIDESPIQKHRHEVLQALADLRSWGEPSLHLIVSSRDYADIRNALAGVSCDRMIINMKNESIEQDIKSFVSQHLRSHQRFRKWEDHFDQIELALSNGAQGVFRWVECQFAALASCPVSAYHLKRTLRSLPRNLDETYARMLRDVDLDCVEDFQRALTLLCCAKRPLVVEELINALAVELGESPKYNEERQLKSSEDLQQICAGFIEIDVNFFDKYNTENQELNSFYKTPGTRYETVRIAHFSVQEYLESDRLRNSHDLADFHVNVRHSNDQMTNICLTFLLEPLTLQQPTSGLLPQRALGFDYYAARYWPSHFKEGNPGTSTNAQALQLFCGKYDVFFEWLSKWDFYEEVSDGVVPTRLYFASVLGLQSIVHALVNSSLPQEPDLALSGNQTADPGVINEKSGRYGTALQAASASGHREIVQLLLEQGAEVNQAAGNYGTALQAASESGHREIVQLLLEQGAEVNQAAGNFGTALQAALARGQREIAQLLLEQGAEVNQAAGFYGTALQAASANGPREIVQLLLEQGAEVNQAAGNYGTALQAASACGQREIVQLLLEQGAEVNQAASNYGTALQAASACGQREIVQLLLKQGAEVNQEAGHYGTALQAASACGHKEIMQLLLEQGAEVNQEAGHYGTALQAALASGPREIMQLLLEQGAEVNQAAGDYGTALQAASESGSREIVQLLLKQGAEVNQEAGFYGTALQAASANGHKEIMQLLLEQGAEVNQEAGHYGTALQAASESGPREIVQLLLEQGAEVNQEAGFYGTALQAASESGPREIVQLLLEQGAEVNQEAGFYGTALQAASESGHREIVQLLLQAGALGMHDTH